MGAQSLGLIPDWSQGLLQMALETVLWGKTKISVLSPGLNEIQRHLLIT